MPFPWLAAAVAGGSILDSVLGVATAKDANRQAQQNAEQQMSFQERMSSTAHQREVNDLRLAGLNPILSAGGSGASSPSGVSAPVQTPHLPSFSSSALATAQAAGQLRAIDATVRATDAQTLNTQASTLETLARTPTHASARDLQAAETKLKKEQRIQLDLSNRRSALETHAVEKGGKSWAALKEAVGILNPFSAFKPR